MCPGTHAYTRLLESIVLNCCRGDKEQVISATAFPMLSLRTWCPALHQWDPQLSSEENAKSASVRATETAGHDLSTQTSVNIVIGPACEHCRLYQASSARAQMKHRNLQRDGQWMKGFAIVAS